MTHYQLSTYSVEGEQMSPPSPEELKGFMDRINEVEERMESENAFVFSARLHGPDSATVVRVADGEVLTTDGPFAEAKERIAGFYIIEAPDLDAALAWASDVTAAIGRPIEVTPFADIKKS